MMEYGYAGSRAQVSRVGDHRLLADDGEVTDLDALRAVTRRGPADQAAGPDAEVTAHHGPEPGAHSRVGADRERAAAHLDLDVVTDPGLRTDDDPALRAGQHVDERAASDARARVDVEAHPRADPAGVQLGAQP